MPPPNQQPEDVELVPAALPEHGEAIDIWEFTSDAVADILECADIAVEAIVNRAEEQVLEDITLAEERAAEETERRRVRLSKLRHELAGRAAQLADSYAAIAAELDLVNQALSHLEPAAPAPPAEQAVVTTVRERHTIHFAGQPPASAGDQLAESGEAVPQPPVHDTRIPWQDAA